MKIFLQSTSVDDVRQASEMGLVDGVTMSAVDLADSDPSADLMERVTQMTQAFVMPVNVPVSAMTSEEMYRDGRALARTSDHVIVQIPFIEDAVAPIRRLVADGVRVCANHIYTGAQAFFAAKVGARMVSVQVDDLDAHGQDSARVVAEIREIIDRADVECDLMVASPRSSQHFTECMLAGANIVCMRPEMLQTLMVHALTDRGVDRFLRGVSRHRKPRSI